MNIFDYLEMPLLLENPGGESPASPSDGPSVGQRSDGLIYVKVRASMFSYPIMCSSTSGAVIPVTKKTFL